MILNINEAKVIQKFLFLSQQDKDFISLDVDEQKIVRNLMMGAGSNK